MSEEEKEKEFTKVQSIRDVMIGYIFNDFIPVFGEIPRPNLFQKFFRWLKRIVKK